MDTWIDSGTTVTPHYDSLLAKLMVLGSDGYQHFFFSLHPC